MSAYPGQELFSFAGPLALAVREGGGKKKQVEWLANVIYLSIYLLFSKQGSIAMQFVTRSKQAFSATFEQNTGNSVLLIKHFTDWLRLSTSLPCKICE